MKIWKVRSIRSWFVIVPTKLTKLYVEVRFHGEHDGQDFTADMEYWYSSN